MLLKSLLLSRAHQRYQNRKFEKKFELTRLISNSELFE